MNIKANMQDGVKILFAVMAVFLQAGQTQAVNLLSDPGFEALSGTAPDVGTSPWFTLAENNDYSFKGDSSQFYSGSQSLYFNYYYDDGSVVQNAGIVNGATNYAFSIWLRTAALASDKAAHTNTPFLSVSIWSAPSIDGTYTPRAWLLRNVTNTVYDTWEQFSGYLPEFALARYHGEYMQLRLQKVNEDVSRRQWLDDVVLEECAAPANDNLLKDPGFEYLLGSEPNSDTSPWFTVDEDYGSSFISDASIAHSGDKSVKLAFYYDAGAIAQKCGIFRADCRYDASIWMLTDSQPSSNSSHTNAASLNISFFTATEETGPYIYRSAFFFGATNTAFNVWEQFSGTIFGSDMRAYDGHYLLIRFVKPNGNVKYWQWLDDASLTATVIHPKGTVILLR